jgi:hypothetical protein
MFLDFIGRLDEQLYIEPGEYLQGLAQFYSGFAAFQLGEKTLPDVTVKGKILERHLLFLTP